VKKELRERKWNEFRKEMETLEDQHTNEMEELRKSIEQLQCKIEEKNRVEGFYKVGTLFSDGFDKEEQTDVQATEQQVGGGAETQTTTATDNAYTGEANTADGKKKDQQYTEDGQLEDIEEDIQQSGPSYKVTFKNQHKHHHIHILNHRHNHYHNDTTEQEVVFTQTETLGHTIVHTATQFQIKRNLIG